MNVAIHSGHQPLINRMEDITLDATAVSDVTALAEPTILITDPKTAPTLLKRTAQPVIVLSDTPSYHEGSPLLALGMRGYANTYIHPDHLQQAITTIRSGNVWLYPEFMQQLIQQATHAIAQPKLTVLEPLTERERETALLVREGLSNKEIASRLGITERTVKQHMSHIFEKLEVSDRFALAMLLK